MITNVPTATDLRQRADALLQLAFSLVMKLYADYKLGEQNGVDAELAADYWPRCAHAIANALSLVQQSHELHLKALIAAVSPYLLIARDPQQWPKEGATKDVSFSEFLTLGAAELPRVHDMVCPERLNDRTREFLRTVRERRNIFVHQGIAPLSPVEEIFEIVLETHAWVNPDQPWFQVRAMNLQNDHISALYNTDHVTAELHEEMDALRIAIKPARFKLWFGAEQKTFWYLCPHCRGNMGDHGDPAFTARLVPNSRTATKITCLVCGEDSVVVRGKCHDSTCPCTVLAHPDSEWGEICLHCGADEDIEADRLAAIAREEERNQRWLASIFGEPADIPYADDDPPEEN
jgi:hypothetical protein